MKNIIKSFIFVFLLFFTSEKVLADGFEINLYYNASTGKLTFDNSATKFVSRNLEADTSIVEYSNDETKGAFILKLYDVKGNEFSSHEFNGTGGSFKLVIPYFSIANQLKIFKKSINQEILSADLSEYLSCNGNGICEVSLGENNSNCLGDCSTKPKVSVLGVGEKADVAIDKEGLNLDKIEKNSSWFYKIFNFFKNLFGEN